MPSTSKSRQNQHYVPQFLLRNFANSKKLYVFDKHTRRVFRSNTKNIASESNFYEGLRGVDPGKVEELLSDLEERAARAVGKLISSKDTNHLSDEEWAWICILSCVQFRRTRAMRNMMADAGAMMLEEMKKRSPGGIHPDLERQLMTQPESEEYISTIFDNLDEGAHLFDVKDKILFKNTTKHKFWISDNPIALYNDNDHSPYGNIGLAVRGIQIYQPLSPDLLLAFWCPTISDQIREEIETETKAIRKRRQSLFLLNNDTYRIAKREVSEAELKLSHFEKFAAEIHSGRSVDVNFENVTFYNSLQVKHSERFVFSLDSNFDLAEKMLSDNSRFERGPRMTMG